LALQARTSFAISGRSASSSTRNDIGTDTATQYAGELATLFRAQAFDGVITYAPSPPVYLGADGNYASWSISVPYKYDHQE
jgi:hypothetical protein